MSDRTALDSAARGRGVVPAFQPMVDLGSGVTVGFEALARWPDGNQLSTAEVFDRADTIGSRVQLNRRCACAALEVAVDADLPARTLVTVNYEPDSPYPGGVDGDLLTRAGSALTVGFEITERCMLTHPRTLLTTVAAMRADGFLVVLDDVGAHPDTLALLDLVEPDIIKLDMGLVQRQTRPQQARSISAVLAHHERTETPILAEGIENETHLEHALALGASLGQGFKYGYPAPLESFSPPAARWQTRRLRGRREAAVPFDLIDRSSVSCRVGPIRILTALSDHIEAQASCASDPPLVLTALQDARYFTPETSRRYSELARLCPLVAVFGEHLPISLGEGVRGVPLSADDPLCAEWTVVALGPQLAVALIARERPGSSGRDNVEPDRHFDFILTFDRRLVTDAAHSLLQRML